MECKRFCFHAWTACVKSCVDAALCHHIYSYSACSSISMQSNTTNTWGRLHVVMNYIETCTGDGSDGEQMSLKISWGVSCCSTLEKSCRNYRNTATEVLRDMRGYGKMHLNWQPSCMHDFSCCGNAWNHMERHSWTSWAMRNTAKGQRWPAHSYVL